MEKILEVYKRPDEAENPVVCMDESPKQRIEEIRQPIPTRPRKTAKQERPQNMIMNIREMVYAIFLWLVNRCQENVI